MNKQVFISSLSAQGPSLRGRLSGAVSQGPSLRGRLSGAGSQGQALRGRLNNRTRDDSLLARFVGFSFTCIVLASVVGCREIDTNVDAAIDSIVLHRLSFIETSTDSSDKLKREVYLRDGAVESIRLREVHFFGLKESEAIVEVDIRNNGDTTTEIIGYNTGCGCSRVELESKVIPPGQQVRIRMSVRINPVNSMSERVVAVALSFKGNCSAQLQLPIVAVPSVRVSGFRGSHRTALDAGTLYVQRRIDDDCENASVEFDVCRGFLETNEASPNESEVRIQGIAPNTLSCHFIGTANEFTERLGGHQIEILSNVVFRNIRLGGGLLNSVNEFLSLEQGDDVLVAVEATPTFGGRFSQLEHHNQARFSIATALRFSMP